MAVPGAEDEDLHDGLTDLTAVSLATREIEVERFAIHRLVQDVTRRSLDATQSRQRVTEALGWVDAAFTGDPADVRIWPRLDPLAPHALVVTQRADTAEIAQPAARLMAHLGVLFNSKSRHAQAEPLLRRALAIAKEGFGPDHPNVATALSNLAHLLKDTNRLAEAEPLMRRSLAVAEANLRPCYPDVAINLNNLEHLLHITDRLAEAEPLYRQALAIDEASLGTDHPTVAIRINNLAELLRATHRLAEAEPLYRRALGISEASLGPDHPNVATAFNNLAQLLRATNRPTEAEPLMRRVVAIFIDFERKTGHPHPHRDRAMVNYVYLLAEMGKSEAKSEAEIKAAIASLMPGGGARVP